jgi:hypothetical protein
MNLSNQMLAIDYLSLVTVIGGLAMVLFFGFYALKLLSNFREGMLEKGWKQVATGALFLIVAQLLFLIPVMGSSPLANALNYIGTATRFLAMAFLILGLRGHYMVWRVNNKKAEAVLPLESST